MGAQLSVDDEKVLKYILQLKRNENNEITFGTKRYSDIHGLSPAEVVQSLLSLQEYGCCSLEFAGPPSHTSLCYITLTIKGLDYLDAKYNDSFKIGATIIANPLKFLFGAIITALIATVIGRLL